LQNIQVIGSKLIPGNVGENIEGLARAALNETLKGAYWGRIGDMVVYGNALGHEIIKEKEHYRECLRADQEEFKKERKRFLNLEKKILNQDGKIEGMTKNISDLKTEISNTKKDSARESEGMTKEISNLEKRISNQDGTIESLKADVEILRKSSQGFRVIRQRFIESYIRDKMGEQSAKQIESIKEGNEAAHSGCAVVDAGLYVPSICGDREAVRTDP
jgi:predicted RNase H-like nuclease (RuvC/YqgF family)